MYSTQLCVPSQLRDCLVLTTHCHWLPYLKEDPAATETVSSLFLGGPGQTERKITVDYFPNKHLRDKSVEHFWNIVQYLVLAGLLAGVPSSTESEAGRLTMKQCSLSLEEQGFSSEIYTSLYSVILNSRSAKSIKPRIRFKNNFA